MKSQPDSDHAFSLGGVLLDIASFVLQSFESLDAWMINVHGL